MTRHRGFTILELLVASFVLALLVTGIFFSFDYGARSFRISTARQGIQGELTRAYDSLRHDLRRSHARTVTIVPRTVTVDGTPRRRDGLCLGGLIDWNRPESFDAVNGLPRWDRYILYYATADGQLVRSYLDPADPDFSPVAYDPLDPNLHMKDDPASNGGEQTGYSVLSRSLLEFQADTVPFTDRVTVRIAVAETNGRSTEAADVTLDIAPQNTWPRMGE